MNKLLHPLLVMIAKATSTELQQYIDYLKAENQILRSFFIFCRTADRPVDARAPD